MSDTLTTYADAFGNWHALVPANVGSRGKCCHAARRAILEKLQERGPIDPSRVHITYVDTDITSNVHHFAEVI